MNIVVLAGGLSPEREVSLTSGSLIANALMKNGHRVLLLDVYLGMDLEGDPLSYFRTEGEYSDTRHPDWVEFVTDINQERLDRAATLYTVEEAAKNGVKLINLGGFGPFGGTLTDELQADILAWVKNMVAECK